MSQSQQNKWALITGASSGIGLELARIHAAAGGHLAIAARRESKLAELKEELEGRHGVKVMTFACDLSRPGAATQLYEDIKAAGIKVDYLINNAGFGGHGKFHERDWEADAQMINLNILALAELTRRFLPDFVARNSGRILNVSSTAGEVPGPLQAVYYASKAFVTSFSNAFAEELSDTNITVTSLKPGYTETEFADAAHLRSTRLVSGGGATAASVAQDGYDAMLAGQLNRISGMGLSQRIQLAMAPMAPRKMLLKQIRQLQEG